MPLAVIFSGASLVLCGFFFIYFRGYLKKRMGKEELLSDYHEEVAKLTADINAAADRDLTLVEARMDALKELLETADRRIAVLVRELERKKDSGLIYNNLGKNAAESPAQSRTGLRPSPAEHPPAEKAPETQVEGLPVAAQAAPLPQDEPKAAEPQKPLSLREKAAELIGAGFSPELTASRLGISVSEVELLVSMPRV
jgi:hypothetical protein